MPYYHNQVQLTGRAGHDPEIYQLSDGTHRLRLRLYQDDRGLSGEGFTPAFHLVAWGNLAESLYEKVKRGSELFVQGELRTRHFEREGIHHLRTEIHINHFLILYSGRQVKKGRQIPSL